MADDRRILVLGSSETFGRGVRSYSWRYMPDGLNVADFDTVILNFAELDDDAVGTNVRMANLPSAEHFARLMFSDSSTIIAFGKPTARLEGKEPGAFGRSEVRSVTATWWLPIDLPVKQVGGESIQRVATAWSFWFDHVKRFEWHFWNTPVQVSENWRIAHARAAVPWAEGFVGRWTPLAETRYSDPLGILLSVTGYRETERATTYRNAEYRTELAPGTIVWLPAPTELAHRDAIVLLLRQVAGVGIETPAPDWVGRFALPSELAAAEEVRARTVDLETATNALRAAEETQVRASRFSALLYEQGKEGLEPVVREALVLLGATVEEPKMEGIEDGRLTAPDGSTAMLEIKGRRGQLKLEDVRQLDGWMRTAIAEEGWSGKGILVANLKLDEPPDVRDDLVAPNALAFAKRVDIAVLTTSQAHQALREREEGTFDAANFWSALLGAAGPVQLAHTQPNVSPGASPA